MAAAFLGAVEDTGGQRRVLLIQGGYAVEDLGAAGVIRPDHIQNRVRVVAQQRGVGDHAAGGRVHDHIVKSGAQPIQKLIQGIAVDEVVAFLGAGAGDIAQRGAWDSFQIIFQALPRVPQKLHQARRIFISAQQAGHALIAQVRVQQHDPVPFGCQGLGQIDAEGGFSFGGDGTGQHNDLAVVLLQMLAYFDPQTPQRLRKGGTVGAGHEASFGTLPPLGGDQGAGGPDGKGHQSAQLIGATDGAGQQGVDRRDAHGQHETDHGALGRGVGGRKGVDGFCGKGGRLTDVEHGVVYHVHRSPGIGGQHRLKDLVGILWRGAGDGDFHHVGICNGAGGDGAPDHPVLQLTGDQVLHEFSVQQVRKGGGNALGGNGIIVVGAGEKGAVVGIVADDRENGGALVPGAEAAAFAGIGGAGTQHHNGQRQDPQPGQRGTKPGQEGNKINLFCRISMAG